MRRRVSVAVVLVVALAAMAAFIGPASGGGRQLSATMSGAKENPPNSSPATGTFAVRLNHGQGTVCYDMSVSNLTTAPSMAHIHRGGPTENGPVVIHLFGSGGAPAPSSTSFTITNFCQSGIDQALIKDIIQNPQNYYANVHTSTFPGGEIRGQLSK
jgi:Cu/Zn superoxide dismutase